MLHSSWITGQVALGVDVFNFLNTEWEPMVEPWQAGFGYAAVDLGQYGSESSYSHNRGGVSGSGASSLGYVAPTSMCLCVWTWVCGWE